LGLKGRPNVWRAKCRRNDSQNLGLVNGSFVGTFTYARSGRPIIEGACSLDPFALLSLSGCWGSPAGLSASPPSQA
jgi:hypothetical protein